MMDLVDELNEQIAIVEYLAAAEDKPGLSNIMLSVAQHLEGVRDELSILSSPQEAKCDAEPSTSSSQQ